MIKDLNNTEKNEYKVSEEYNAHTINKKLKEFIYTAKQVNKMGDIDILISDVKDFIFRVPMLRDEYNKRLDDATRFNNRYKHFGLYIKHRIVKLLDHEKLLTSGLNRDFTLSIGEYYYYPILNGFIINNLGIGNGVELFYRQIIDNYYSERSCINIRYLDFFRKYGVQKLNHFINFYTLSIEDSWNIGTSFFTDSDFFIKWQLSALIGCLYDLQTYVKTKIVNKNKTEIEQKIISTIQEVNNQEKLPHAKLQGRLHEIFDELCKDIALTAPDIAEFFGTKQTTVEKQIKYLACKLGRKGKKGVVAYIKENKLNKSK